MDTLLIVEDEKMIRRGISVMAQRASVEIKEIIECRNGEEAMEVLKSRKIDTVFTDIRMPKMDGIQLVKEIERLEYKPDIVVISGYDDFNYAVEMLQHGAADYILKPVKREKIEEIMKKLEAKQKSSSQSQWLQKQMLYSQIRCCLLSQVSEPEYMAVKQQWETCFGQNAYVAAVFSDRKKESEKKDGRICVSQINNQTALFLPADEYEVWKKETEADFYGVSLPARGFEECKRAFEQAEKARKSAFVTGKRCCIYKETEFSAEGLEKEAEQFVQQFSGTGRNAAVKKLLNRCFQARHGEESPEKILLFLTLILKKLEVLCRNLIERKEILDYEEPLIWDTLEQYEGYLKTWLDRLGECMEEQFSCDQNKRKIQQAVSYIQENYAKDLNMAIVSNYVSMNYSLFSIEFKNYTGVNFVNYLKEIRIKEAKKLLEDTQLKIQEVGKMVGYENDKHFMKIFKSICGISPSEYRKIKNSISG